MTVRKKAIRKRDRSPSIETEGHRIIDDFKGATRLMNGELDIMVDTFKLDPAVMQKNVSWTLKEQLVPIEHCHIYHTYDSNGKKLDECNAVGGHKHTLNVEVINGQFQVSCSPPIQSAKSETISKIDDHVHAVRYLKSEQLQMRKANMEAAQVATAMYTPVIPPLPAE